MLFRSYAAGNTDGTFRHYVRDKQVSSTVVKVCLVYSLVRNENHQWIQQSDEDHGDHLQKLGHFVRLRRGFLVYLNRTVKYLYLSISMVSMVLKINLVLKSVSPNVVFDKNNQNIS